MSSPLPAPTASLSSPSALTSAAPLTSDPPLTSTPFPSTPPDTAALPSDTTSDTTGATNSPQIKVLFAGLSNICRSQAAVSVFRVLAYQKGVAPWFTVDSCGTGGGNNDWFRNPSNNGAGKVANDRMRLAGGRRGLVVDGVSKAITPEELYGAAIVVAMDGQVMEEIRRATRYWGVQTGTQEVAEIRRISEFSNRKEFRGRAMPDPTLLFSEELFDHTLDLLEECCGGLLDYLVGQVTHHPPSFQV